MYVVYSSWIEAFGLLVFRYLILLEKYPNAVSGGVCRQLHTCR